ncbi:arsenate reductase ArsC [Vreelandella salicampi]|uniref:Arsenate reductase ArsC n=1 Tax=Vreelandella salicampi TaxID=1449798 RepID=A0A7Z0LL09_9GAMM|nr:arsenate reductase ArsC [Halomonas salicampi]NYS60912.1 arsenate reductase ArsC [Halomonas salicampi]
MNILFLCAGNSCRSIYAEAVFNHYAQPHHHAYSAGSHPTGELNPQTLDWLEQEGISIQGLTSKSWDDIAITPDVVITVCDDAAGEVCPLYLGKALRVHWGVPDPSHTEGSNADENESAFSATFNALHQGIKEMATLPLDALSPAELKTQLNAIHQHFLRTIIQHDDQYTMR